MVARQLGYHIRQEWLGGAGSGHCLLRGRRVILLDLAQTPNDQLDAVRDALRGEIFVTHVQMSRELAESLDVRAVA
jgi:hypothetical protein